jgi:hypothetical protein
MSFALSPPNNETSKRAVESHMNAIKKLSGAQEAAKNDPELSGIRGDNVESSGVRGKRGRHAEQPVIIAENHEETALARLLFGWGTTATVVGMTLGGILFDPVGALLGAVVGSVVGIGTVVMVVLARGPALTSNQTQEGQNQELDLD